MNLLTDILALCVAFVVILCWLAWVAILPPVGLFYLLGWFA